MECGSGGGGVMTVRDGGRDNDSEGWGGGGDGRGVMTVRDGGRGDDSIEGGGGTGQQL